MILEALHRLATQEGLMSDPDYEIKPVAWLVRVADGGELIGIDSTHYTPDQIGKKKPKAQAKNLRIPRQPIRTSGDRAFFLCDKLEYALGVDTETDLSKRRSPEKLATRFRLFRNQVRDCVVATGDAGVSAMLQLLEDVSSGKAVLPVLEGASPGDQVAFIYAPDIDSAVHERPAVRAFWKAQRTVEESPANIRARCVISGDPVSESVNFPLLKRIPGGTPSGVSLVSFNAGAFESHGWRGNENVPISRGAAEAVATALNRLLHPAFPDPNPERSNETLPKRHFRITSDTVVCFWASDQASSEFLDFFAELFNPDDPQVVGEAYRSIWRGHPVPISDPARFYALTITGTQGRAVLRDWFESSVADVVQHMADYFADIEIVRNTPPPKGRELPPQLSLNLLLDSLAPLGKRENIPAALATQLISAALRGSRYPTAVLQKAVERARAEVGRTEWADLARRDARAALIKAVLRRNNQQELAPDMDPNNREPGYLLGRLMAVLERLQQLALGDVNANVIDRFFGAASATPQAVFPRLLKNSRHHARKAADDAKFGGTASWMDRQIDEIVSHLGVRQPARGAHYVGFPSYLPLEQQGLFVLGYHHQRHWLWLSREERERRQQEHSAAQAAVLDPAVGV